MTISPFASYLDALSAWSRRKPTLSLTISNPSTPTDRDHFPLLLSCCVARLSQKTNILQLQREAELNTGSTAVAARLKFAAYDACMAESTDSVTAEACLAGAYTRPLISST